MIRDKRRNTDVKRSMVVDKQKTCNIKREREIRKEKDINKLTRIQKVRDSWHIDGEKVR